VNISVIVIKIMIMRLIFGLILVLGLSVDCLVMPGASDAWTCSTGTMMGRLRPIRSKIVVNMVDDADLTAARAKAVRGKSFFKAKLIGVGAKAGSHVMPNDDFVSLVDTSDKWISRRTGIRNRHLLEPGTSLRDIAARSASDAIKNAGINPDEIDLVIVATSSPDDLFGDAASIASAIHADNAAAFDITAACSGFLYGIVTASQYLHTGAYKKIVVVGADALSRFVDWEDRGTCILFGDGSGAVVMEATENVEDSGVLGFALKSNGDGYNNLKLTYNSNFQTLDNDSKTQVNKGSYGYMIMNGPEVYKFAVSKVPEIIELALFNSGLQSNDIDWLLLHQANLRIMEHASEVLGIPMNKVLVNLMEYGNTSAGSIPLALKEAVNEGKIKKGDIIAVAGFGAGLNWGAAILRWGG
jgi:3-oxoacyl-[acyl-carrier-protein] synthase III